MRRARVVEMFCMQAKVYGWSKPARWLSTMLEMPLFEQSLGKRMSSLKRLWKASRQDATAAFGTDARPGRPGEAARLHPEERQKRLLKHLTATGKFNLSESGYQKLRDVLRAAQGRSARKKVPKQGK